MNDKKRLIITIVAVLILTIGVTLAYFIPQIGGGILKNINVTAENTDEFWFAVDNDTINLKLTQFNLIENGENLDVSTTAMAFLAANDITKSASYKYNVYFLIEKNSFVYTTQDKKTEIVLTIIDPNGTELNNLNGLNYLDGTTTGGVKGFDITTIDGLFHIASDYSIVATPSNTFVNQNWQFKITFINLENNQVENEGKELKARIFMQQGEFKYISNICTENQLLNECIKKFGDLGYDSTRINIHNTGLKNGASDNFYRYSGSSKEVNNFVCFGTDISPCPVDNLYRIIGVFGENYHGVSGQELVKLIKYDYANSNLLGNDGDYSNYALDVENYSYYKGELTNIDTYYWNYNANTSDPVSSWNTSLLNKINLNTNFLNNIGVTWANKIQSVTWKIAGNTGETIMESPPSIAYQNEIIAPDTEESVITYLAKIGLMYISDYGFASYSDGWGTQLGAYDYDPILSNHWMFMGMDEWTISRSSDRYDAVYNISEGGSVSCTGVFMESSIRPVFNLISSTTYKSGSGTMSDPIIIN